MDDLDEEYELLCEVDQLAFEARYWEAEADVVEREVAQLRLTDHERHAEHWSMLRQHGAVLQELDRYEPPTSYDVVERCCYALRREHRQWPTGPELAERIATEMQTTHAMAGFLIDRALNDRTEAARLYLALWLLGDEPRLFVDASAVQDLDRRYMTSLALEAA